jgi:hypothetical protein
MLHRNTSYSTKCTAISNNQQPTGPEPEIFAMVKIVTSHAQALDDLPSKFVDSLDLAT